MIFAWLPSFKGDERESILLALSLRKYGGRFSGSQMLVLEAVQSPLSAAACRALTSLGAAILPFRLPEAALGFPYAAKVFAAAEAEARCGSQTLVWMDSDTVILDQPDEFVLPADKAVGCCPVQLKNICSLASEAPSAFWQAVYAGCKTPLARVFPLTTTMDGLAVHAQFNAGLLVVRPEAGLLAAWKHNFEHLYQAAPLQPFYAANQLYLIFIHQAVLSATFLARLPRQAFQLLSTRYNMAIFLRQRFPLSISDPVTCRYDEFAYLQSPGWADGIPEIGDKVTPLMNQAAMQISNDSQEAR